MCSEALLDDFEEHEEWEVRCLSGLCSNAKLQAPMLTLTHLLILQASGQAEGRAVAGCMFQEGLCHDRQRETTAKSLEFEISVPGGQWPQGLYPWGVLLRVHPRAHRIDPPSLGIGGPQEQQVRHLHTANRLSAADPTRMLCLRSACVQPD